MEYKRFEFSSIGDGKGKAGNGLKTFFFVLIVAILIYAITRVKKYLEDKKAGIMRESLK